MMDLSGRTDCDIYIRDELRISNIGLIHGVKKPYFVVPYSVTGSLGNARFTRQWDRWCVKCKIPLEVADEMYSDPIGRTDMWLDGQPFRPPPGLWGTEYYDAAGTQLIPEIGGGPMGENLRKHYEKRGCRIVNLLPADARGFVVEYHITTLQGLSFFADTLRRYRLV